MIEWRKVEGFSYEVSNDGQVRRIGRDRVLRPGYDKQTGYLKVSLCRPDIRQITMRVHCLVATAFLGPKPEGAEINHKDRNRQNNRDTNLEYLTHPKNVEHSKLSENWIRGENNGQAKIGESDVIMARHAYSEGRSFASLAREFGVSDAAIRDAITGVNWNHLPNPVQPRQRTAHIHHVDESTRVGRRVKCAECGAFMKESQQ